MKSTSRGSLTALLACAAVAAGSGSAVAGERVPVSLPMEGLEHALGLTGPRVGAELPVPVPGAVEGPRYVEGRLMPSGIVPVVPFSVPLPGAEVDSLVPRVFGGEADRVRALAGGPDAVAGTPGLTLDAPLTAPRPDAFGLPAATLPVTGLQTPPLRTAPAAHLLAH
ncbi:hypothetical protein JNUCC64_18995 [Streptomyces sp. JNUCC 64]